MRLPNRNDLWLVLSITLLSALLVITGSGIVRALAALPLVFVTPGYGILAAWFPRRLASFPGGILLVLALSLAIAALGGLVLNLTPGGLTPGMWAGWFESITLVNCIIALRRQRRNLAETDRVIRFGFGQVVLILGAALIMLGAVWVAREGATLQQRDPFTQLWMFPADTPNAVRVGVRNEEGQTVTYRLVIAQDEPLAQNDLTLAAGESWEGLFSYTPDTLQMLIAELYRVDAPAAVYRRVTLSLTANGAG